MLKREDIAEVFDSNRYKVDAIMELVEACDWYYSPKESTEEELVFRTMGRVSEYFYDLQEVIEYFALEEPEKAKELELISDEKYYNILREKEQDEEAYFSDLEYESMAGK